MKLTKEYLKQTIEEVLMDLDLLLPYPLAHEPSASELTEGLTDDTKEKIISVLQDMNQTDRESIFRRFGFEKSAIITKRVLQNISDINRSQKGTY